MLPLAFALSFFGQHWDKYAISVNELNLRKTEGMMENEKTREREIEIRVFQFIVR